MKVQAPFGFVTGCHARDKFLVQATLASMRHYCPDVPICLTVDGNFDVSDLQNDYNLIVLRVSELPSTEMRELMWGNHRAKLAALWEGPFEFYVWFDSDAIAWGDFTSQVRTDLDFQIFWSEISIPAEEIKTGRSNLQHIWEHHGKQELIQDCRGAGWRFPKMIDRPRIAHFCGRKPFLFDRKAYSRPFTIARLEHHRKRYGTPGAWFAVLQEDCRRLARKIKRRVGNLLSE